MAACANDHNVSPEVSWLPVHILSPHTALVDATAELLESQWPTGGGVQGRKRRLLRSRNELPASFVAFISDKQSGKVVGHASLRAASEISDGLSAIVFSILVSPLERRRGLGRYLMSNIEDEARKRGFSYLYLFTDDQQPFYEACGYTVCDRIASIGAVSRHLNEGSLSNLQRIVAQKNRAATSTGLGSSGKFSGDGSISGVDAIWMRKPLVESIPHQVTKRSDDIDALISAANTLALKSHGGYDRASIEHLRINLENNLAGDISAIFSVGSPWQGDVFDATWERQVGPSCGLAMIRVLRRMLTDPLKSVHAKTSIPLSASFRQGLNADERGRTNVGSTLREAQLVETSFLPAVVYTATPDPSLNAETKLPSLLLLAQSRGVSKEGEVFSTSSLASLAADFCGMHMAVAPFSFASLSAAFARRLPVLVCYDRDHNTHLPREDRGGASAHWAIIRGWALSPASYARKDNGGNDASTRDEERSVDEADRFLLLLSHGMSAHPFVCTLRELQRSNGQLFASRALAERLSTERQWLIPPEGPDLAGLCIVPVLGSK